MANKYLDYKNVDIIDGFWQTKQNMLRESTVWAVYDRFKETGRFDAFKCDKNAKIKPHIYWDSDVAKWIEGAAYLIKKSPDPHLEEIIDEVVLNIEKNRLETGYFNSYYIACEPDGIFKNRDCHELYCAGHLIEAAVAYAEATGKRKFLDLMIDYVNYIEYRFKTAKDTGFKTPGHEEIELALVRLYRFTGEKRFLDLARFFVLERGKVLEGLTDWSNEGYHQSHLPAKEQKTAVGHSVRATYFYSAMADLALIDGDIELKTACESIFDDIITHKMYITGGIGSTHIGEAFTTDYDLPSEMAYAESCAAIGLIFFAHRMLVLTGEKKYADLIERVLYNGFLSSVSLDGKSFFYVNPLEIVKKNHTRHFSVKNKDPLPPMTRFEVFDCSCCPPNIVRFLGSLGSLLYTYNEKGIYLQQYASSVAKFELDGKEITLTQKTNYPENGKISLISDTDVTVFVRIPEYLADLSFATGGYLSVNLKAGVEKTIEFEIPTTLIEGNPKILATAGKVAVMRGPIVYCMEGCDNQGELFNIRISKKTPFVHGFNNELGVPTITVDAYIKENNGALYSPMSVERQSIGAKLIPYYAFANRGENDMQIWSLVE